MAPRLRLTAILFLLLATLGSIRLAAADPPPPISSGFFSLPGANEQPASARSAGLGLADEWLGISPFSNPAVPRGIGVTVSPALLRLSRQDLRAGNRNYDEKAAVLDGAGAAISTPYAPIWLYVSQPVLRFEDFAFNRGTILDPSVQPAVITGQADMRETRVGLSASYRVLHGLRFGAGVEWTRRDDRYDSDETSGAPDQGSHHLDFAGEGVGGTLGFRFDSADSGAGVWTVGGALRYVPELDLEGRLQYDLLSGSGDSAFSATREAGVEGGLAAAFAVTRAMRLMLSIGGHSKQEWEGLDLTAGSAVAVRLGGEFHDDRDPWTLRFGVGQEQQRGVPEPRAGSVGLGFGYDWEGIVLDLGVIHRGMERAGRPRSYDDRLVGSVTVEF
jgi:hypothetical protein